MEDAKIKELKSDSQVIKFTSWSGGHFKSEKGTLIVMFYFMHAGLPETFAGAPDRRIGLHVHQSENLKMQIPFYQVKNDFLVMVNADNLPFALTYRVTIDEENKSAKVIIEDYPVLGGGLIGNAEVEGLEVHVD